MRRVLAAMTVVGLLLTGGLWTSGLGWAKTDKPTAQKAEAATKAAKASAQTVYVCPMHGRITSNRPGKCPKCGMQLVAKKATKPMKSKAPAKKATAAKKTAYICPCGGCAGITSDRAGKCPKCGMDLAPKKT